MYSSIIEIKKNIKGEALEQLRKTAEKAFDNRAGKVANSSDDTYKFIFKGDENAYPCLDLGTAFLARESGFLGQVISWWWLDDEEPNDNCDVLEAYAEPVR